ncbi:tripartite tricarboxylate transporter substrate binding protein [uncultured Ferrovibrio sp.]|uniref:Bug family tripartite tricarboxylate transporter substrate binding protein n=1 Tax=uncultured Ferrovibrio sp. TaxID=1576913 RepID=UPI00263190B4|nr:tripartite tricarboxylate transporter substrate binding protein [uncultured Ferrovibrio sp.]
MRITRRSLLNTAAAFASTAFAVPGLAQQWPTRSIKILSAYPPGGLVDLFARAYGAHISVRLGQPVLIENRPGASGIVAAQAMIQAPPDGYTLMATLSSALISNRVLYETLPYDPDKDFSLISSMSTGQLPLIVHKSTGVTNLAELAQYARSHPVNFGNFGQGTYGHLATLELNRHFGIQMEPVQYRGEAPMWKDLAAGIIQCATGTYPGAISVIQSGEGRAIAMTHDRRMKRLPDVPTYLEQGLPSRTFQLKTFVCLVGPAGMSEAMIKTLSRLAVEAGETEQMKAILDTFGIEEAATDDEAFKRLLAEETGPWTELVRSLGLAASR